MRSSEHIAQFISKEESDGLYAALASFPFVPNEDTGDYEHACYFGKSYTLYGGPRPAEQPDIQPILLPLAKRVAEAAHAPANYIQIHRMKPAADVRPTKIPQG